MQIARGFSFGDLYLMFSAFSLVLVVILLVVAIAKRRISSMMPLLICGSVLNVMSRGTYLFVNVGSRMFDLRWVRSETTLVTLAVVSFVANLIFVLGLVLVIRDVASQMSLMRDIIESGQPDDF